jgi:hypothetical protein
MTGHVEGKNFGNKIVVEGFDMVDAYLGLTGQIVSCWLEATQTMARVVYDSLTANPDSLFSHATTRTNLGGKSRVQCYANLSNIKTFSDF